MPDGVAAFFGQLFSPTHVLDVRPRRLPSIFLISRSCDSELDAVQNLLGVAGVPSVRVNADELDTADLVANLGSDTVRVNGRPFIPTVTWVRHFSTSAIDPPDGAVRQTFLRESWQGAVDQLVAISAIHLCSRGPGILSQLRIARHHGIAVPRTILTTDPYRARDAFTCQRVVIKAAYCHFVEGAPGRLSGIFPTIIERHDLPDQPNPGPPVIVQEYLEHETELRIYWVNHSVHAFEIVKDSPAAPWTTPHQVEIKPVPAPAEIVAATTVLAAAMSLHYGAFDYVIHHGQPILLEVNPDGDWRWVEHKAGCDAVTREVTRLLVQLHQTASPRQFDMLGFLSGSSTALRSRRHDESR